MISYTGAKQWLTHTHAQRYHFVMEVQVGSGELPMAVSCV